MQTLKSAKFWAFLAIFLFLSYSLIGFFLVPYLATNILPKKLKESLNITTTIQKADFNPFTFSLNLKNANFTTKDKKPLLEFENLKIDMSPNALLYKTISFKEVSLQKPQLHLIIDKSGKLNILNLSNDTNSTKNSSKSSWNSFIANIDIKNGSLSFEDERETNPFSFTLKPINYEGKNISTKKGEVSLQILKTKGTNAKNLTVDANLTISPFKSQGAVNIQALSIGNLLSYSLGKSGFYPKKTIGNVSFFYVVEVKQNGLSIGVKDVDLSLNDIEIYEKDDKISNIENLTLKNLDLNADIFKDKKSIKVTNGSLKSKDIRLYDSDTLPLKGKIDEFGLDGVVVDFTKKDGLSLHVKDTLMKNGDINYKKYDIFNESFTTLNLESLSLHAMKNQSISLKKLKLENLDIKNSILDRSFLHVKDLSLANSSLIDEKYKGDSLDIKDVNFTATFTKDKTLDFLKGLNDDNESKDENNTFSYELKKFHISGGRIEYSDENTKKIFTQKLSFIDLELKDILSKNLAYMPYDLTLKNEDILSLKSKGKISLKPLHVKGDIYLKDNDIQRFNPYIYKYTNLKVIRGKIDTNMSADFKDKKLSFKADSLLKNIDIKTKDSKPFLNFSSFDLKGINFNQSKNTLSLKNAILKNPNSYIYVKKDGKTSLENIVKTKPNKSKKSKTKFTIDVDNIEVKNGGFFLKNSKEYKDLDLHANSINAKIKPFYQSKKKSSNITLKALIQDSGNLDINAKVFPKDIKKDTNLEINLKDLEAKSISSYAKKYISYDLKNGTISSNYKQNIKDAKLKANANINLQSVHLGDHKDSKFSLKLPLNLAFSLLRNSKGDIDLNIPISGDMNEPTFNYGLVLVTAFRNIITNVISSPFTLLGNILGIDGKKLKTIDFEASSYALLDSQKRKTKQYKIILQKRPNLKLTITGSYDSSVDLPKNSNKDELINLADKRANAIKDELINLGIKEDKILIQKPTKTHSKDKKWVSCKIGLES